MKTEAPEIAALTGDDTAEETSQKPKETTKPAPRVKNESKSIKHVFTKDELERLSENLVEQIGRQRRIEDELQEVKSQFKAKLDETEARIGTLHQSLTAKWEMRQVECRVEYRPKDRKKDFYCLRTGDLVLTEDMNSEDFQTDLLIADSKLDAYEEIQLWEAGSDNGRIVVGRLGNKWVAAVRARVGHHTISERCDSEQRAFKARFDAIKQCAKRGMEWLKKIYPEAATGFEEQIKKAVDAQKEREE